MDLEKYLGWSSPIGAFLILTGLGLFFLSRSASSHDSKGLLRET